VAVVNAEPFPTASRRTFANSTNAILLSLHFSVVFKTKGVFLLEIFAEQRFLIRAPIFGYLIFNYFGIILIAESLLS